MNTYGNALAAACLAGAMREVTLEADVGREYSLVASAGWGLCRAPTAFTARCSSSPRTCHS